MKTLPSTLIGIAYGFILLLLGFVATGFGHGVYIPIMVFSSPIWNIMQAVIPSTPENQTLALISFALAMVLLWGCAGWLAASLSRRSARFGLLVLLMVHYAAFPFVFLDGDWSYFPRVWEKLSVILVMGFCLYLVGQAVLWFRLIASFLWARESQHSPQ